jgi:hypothetical protein
MPKYRLITSNDLSDQDLNNIHDLENISLADLVPYTGAIADLDLGTHNLSITDTISTDQSIGEVNIGGGTVATGSGQDPFNVGGDINDYLGINLQNRSTLDSASGDIVISADNDGADFIGHYANLGILNSGWVASTTGQAKTVTVNAAGTGYTIGDILTISGGGDGNAEVEVLTVGGSGQVLTISLYDNGTGYTAGLTNLATTGGTGSACTLNVTAIINQTGFSALDGYVLTSGGHMVICTDDSVAGKSVKVMTGGYATTNLRLTIADALITSTVAMSLGTTNALTCGSVNLGHASDTTLSRGAAGFLAVEGKRVPSPAS